MFVHILLPFFTISLYESGDRTSLLGPRLNNTEVYLTPFICKYSKPYYCRINYFNDFVFTDHYLTRGLSFKFNINKRVNVEIKQNYISIALSLDTLIIANCISGVMVSVLSSSVVDCGFEPQSVKTKDYIICNCCFSTHTVLRRKSNDWWARNQNNVSEWNDRSTHRLLFQWASTINIKLSMLV